MKGSLHRGGCELVIPLLLRGETYMNSLITLLISACLRAASNRAFACTGSPRDVALAAANLDAGI